MTVVIERDQWQAYVAHLPAPPQTASATRSANTLICPAVPGHGDSLNGGYLSVTSTNA
jgi:hypothetical protein